MTKTNKPKKSSVSGNSRLYLEIEEKILLRVVLPLQKAGMTDQEIASQLKLGVKHVRQLIQQAEEKEALRSNGSQTARNLIQQAIADLQAQEALPDDLAARRRALSDYGISQTALTKYASLWSPDYLHQSRREIWNQQQAESARERIRQAIADLQAKGTLPEKRTARFNQLIQYKIGGSTLYKHRDLWDPQYHQESENLEIAV